jgi:hypothetical protein
VDESMTKTKEIATKVVEDWNYNDYDSCNDNCFGPKLHTDKLENRIHKAILEVKLEILAGIDTVEAHIKLKERFLALLVYIKSFPILVMIAKRNKIRV